MRLAAMAAMLAVAAGSTPFAARAGHEDQTNGEPDAGNNSSLSAADRQSMMVAYRARELVRETQRREADARCGCDSTSGGQAARAGF